MPCGVVWYYVACETRLILLSNIAKKKEFRKKNKTREWKSVNIGKKTIQVSNFHNPAETNNDSKEPLVVF